MRRQCQQFPKRQRGAVAVVVGIAIFVLVGMIGLALDLGQMFVNKTELQNAADACALAAARELDGNADALDRADAAGVLVGTQNLVGFQKTAVTLTADAITYSEQLSPNSTYVNNASPAKAKFAMCKVERTDIGMWFMGLRGFDDQTVSAYAVATLLPAQTSCALPIGFCPNTTPPEICSDGKAPDKYGLCVGDWRDGRFAANDGATGNFNWIDFTGKGGGAKELAEVLLTGMCDIEETGEVELHNAKPGEAEAASHAWNTRFGVYKPGQGNPSAVSNPPALPDFTGFSYAKTAAGKLAWPAQRNALANFLAHRVDNDPYQWNIPGFNASTKEVHGAGADRRIVPVPIVFCDQWGSDHVIEIKDWACVLLLHPIDKPIDPVHMEYLGLASEPGTPCATHGIGVGSIGPLVPVLVQ